MPAAASWCADVRRARQPSRPPPRRPARAAGFTLLEILIALAIVSVALAAVMRTTGMLTTNNGVLRERALALLSAQNRLIELQLAPPALTASGDKAACPQGPLALVCYSRYTDAREGARTVTVEVYLDHRPTPRLATLSGIVENRSP
ncbi:MULTISPECIES: type II secretion system minor pseudopilin GspI [Achromobacter]|jgi:general secretion pathway protein I|uniref:type II secretion system minor pseudopilin GspI n=1 Tax=Achromobacter TaxID=222 RepID=UPI0006C216BF|nr:MULTISPECIES: type II secretion system minor pseudopilin GspI [Achromobacter]CUJ26456.1 Tfp pilus assembly protein PilV [Achromobacter sp. 2789STDY5608628]CUJ79388.1 Tfp pilus assembly protein PilV [Achromobacter sp. 2789STDY5608633]